MMMVTAIFEAGVVIMALTAGIAFFWGCIGPFNGMASAAAVTMATG